MSRLIDISKLTPEQLAKRARLMANNKRWRERHPDKVKAYTDKTKVRRDQYYQDNRAKKIAYTQDYTKKHKDKILKYDRERSRLRRKDPEYREWKRAYDRTRENKLYATDLNFAIMKRLRSRIRRVLESDFAVKSAATMELVGCNLEQLKAHLTATFSGGMSWALLNKLAIDHIQPCCSFDLTKPEEQRKCFHYTNLRFMWWEDNLRKANDDRKLSHRLKAA